MPNPVGAAPARYSDRLLVVVGPTAVGKSEFALLACERFGGEVVSVDSMQVYRGLDRGTAKPTPEVRRRVPHHGIDLADPGRDFSLGDFVRAAGRAIDSIRGRSRLPVLVGGTGLYLRGLLKGIVEAPRRQEAVQVLEVYFASRHGLSELIRASPFGADRYASVKIGLSMERAALYRIIDARVERFFAAGLLEEVQGLLRGGCPETANAFKAIGYHEALRHLRGEMDLREAIALTQRSTRRYAKRQWTWFRKEEGVTWFTVDPSGPERFSEPLAHAAMALGRG